MHYITWTELGLMIVFSVVIVVGVYLVRLLRNLNESVKVVKEILNKNKGRLDETLTNLPAISQNLNNITSTLNSELKTIEGAVSSISETVEMTAATAQVIKDDILTKLKSFLELIDIIKRLFFSSKDTGEVK